MKIKNFKNIFLDRDGIINDVVIRKGVVSSPRNIKEFQIKHDFIAFSEQIENSLDFFVVSNQPDITRKLLKEEDLNLMNKQIGKFLKIKEISYCPHDDANDCLCRKPKPGMIDNIIEKYNLIKSDCLLIGDSYKDMGAALNAGISFTYLKTHYNKTLDRSFTISSLQELL
jgi:D-glycero-D-manno-heptose 1,7-bisphosphate phosphatase